MKQIVLMAMLLGSSCFAGDFGRGGMRANARQRGVIREGLPGIFIVQQQILDIMAVGLAPEEKIAAKEGRYKKISRKRDKMQGVPKKQKFPRERHTHNRMTK